MLHLIEKPKPMRYFLVISFAIYSYHSSFSQALREKELKTQIREVTVFLSSAQIFEGGSADLPSGSTLLVIKNLPTDLDEKSIQVKGDGDFTILSVNYKRNYLNTRKRDEKIDSLKSRVELIELDISRDRARLDVLGEKLSLLSSNKTLGGSATGVSIAQLKQAMELFESEIQSIKHEEIAINAKLRARLAQKGLLEMQLKEANEKSVVPTGEIEISVKCDGPVTAKFRVTYLVGNAGWFPKYDVRVENIRKPLEITYKAEVFQNTGTDWKNVKLRFSNANPNQSGSVPELNTWNLTFAQYLIDQYRLYGKVAGLETQNVQAVRGRVVDSTGSPMAGVNVIVKGTTVGTATDVDGNYSLTIPAGSSAIEFSFIGYESLERPITGSEINVSLKEDVMALQEVVTVGYGVRRAVRVRGMSSLKKKDEVKALATTTIENQTTVEIEVTEPYSIKSTGEKLLVDLKKIEVQALYQYYAIPKLDKDAFLVARIVNWDQYNLLEGEANLYFEDAFVGRSVLNAKSLSDTLDISLGRDKNIVVGREKNEEYCKHRFIGSNVSETRGFRILVRNKKTQSINITIQDQVPVSLLSDISVEVQELSGGDLTKSSGKIAWELTIDPQQQKELVLLYEVRYPKREKVVLE